MLRAQLTSLISGWNGPLSMQYKHDNIERLKWPQFDNATFRFHTIPFFPRMIA